MMFGEGNSMSSKQKTFLLCHGAWGGGWSWKKMHPLMQAAGHRLLTPTYTGLGERAHLANPDVDLETHIQDILNVIKYEDLHDIVLLGHSYGGMVATGVADRARDCINQVIYLDAFVPRDGQSLFDLNEAGRQPMSRRREGRRRLAHSAKSVAAGHVAGRSRLAGAAPGAHADQMLREQAQAAARRDEIAAQLHLLQPQAGRQRPVRAICRAPEERSRLALFRDGRQPLAECHRARSS